MSIDYTQWSPHINQSRCTGCRYCVDLCPTDALSQTHGKAQLAHPDRCTYCLACEDVCPTMAIELPFLIVKQTRIHTKDHSLTDERKS